jgi:hypothetical protein
VSVARDGQDGDGGQLAPDLGEDPDEVDVEAMAGGERSGDVDVVIGIRVGRCRKMDDQEEPHREGDQKEGNRGSHGRCRVAPGLGPSDRYQWMNRPQYPSGHAAAPDLVRMRPMPSPIWLERLDTPPVSQ